MDEPAPVAGALGAEIHGIALTDATEHDIETILAALHEHLVLFFPDQHLDRDAHVAFARRFGELEVFHPQVDDSGADAHPELLVLESEQGLIADMWHTDVTWSPSPPVMSIVRMVRTPPSGGDTMWTNQEKAYASLSAPIRELLLGLTAVHTGRSLGRPRDRATHPVVRRHPVTGRPSLYVNRQFTSHIVELSPGESDSLLAYLYDWSEQPTFTCRRAWSAGTVAMWDNRNTQHYVVNDFTEPRVLERVTVVGDHPEPADDRTWPPYDPGGVSASAGPAILRG